MAEKPILFSGAMVTAILAGRKTVTRRILKPQPAKWEARVIDITPPFFNEEEGGWGQVETIWSGPLVPGMCEPEREEWSPLRLPYAAGDRLWVREACRAEETPNGIDGVRYAADDAWRVIENTPEASDAWVALYHYRSRGKNGRGNPVPSIHMPRWASRITLEVTEVRVQRLNEISGEDTISEGVQCPTCEAMKYSACHDSGCFHSIQLFKELWCRLHGPGAWDANPWVVAVTFKRLTP